MAYSQFLQHRANKLKINIGPGYVGGEMLVCRRMLEGLHSWLAKDEHEEVLSAIDMLKSELFAINNEIDTMDWQGQLMEFWQSNIIMSIGDLKTNIRLAYNHAFAASEEKSDGKKELASQHIYNCHDYIQRALADIVINR